MPSASLVPASDMVRPGTQHCLSVIVMLLLTRGAVNLVTSTSFPRVLSPVRCCCCCGHFAANYEAGSRIHNGSSHFVDFSKMEASSGPDKRKSYGEFPGHGAKRSWCRGLRAASTKRNSCCLFSLF